VHSLPPPSLLRIICEGVCVYVLGPSVSARHLHSNHYPALMVLIIPSNKSDSRQTNPDGKGMEGERVERRELMLCY